MPRVFTPPLRKLTPRTSAGFACITFAEEVLGIELFPWQKWFLIHALELLADGSFRFRTVVLLVARQNGKSTLAQVLALYFMYLRGARLVIGTAQNLDIAEEVWAGAVELAEECEELADEIKKVNQTNGKKSLDLKTGERYKVQTASRRGGRGLSGDLILLDELREHQSWDAWGAITKTTMARAMALILALSNAGDASSIVLRYLRKMAHASLGDPDGINSDGINVELLTAVPEELEEELGQLEDDSLGIFEWSAPPGCALDDRDGWAAANPSLGYSITERAIASACKTDPEWVFRTEVLCQWNDGVTEGPFPSGAWEAGTDVRSEIPAAYPVTYCVDTEHDRSRAFIAAAGRRLDGGVHVEVIASRHGQGWVVDWFKSRASETRPMRVVVQSRGAPVSGLVEDLEEIPFVTVVPWGGADLGAGCGDFYDGVRAHVWKPDPENGETEADRPTRIWHLPQPVLDLAAGTAVTKPLGDAWAWNRQGSPYGAAPLMAVSGAAWDVMRPEVLEVASAYESGDLMVV
ncbi:terminase [Arthrobacter phage Kuleana]|uniref:Terminase n=1 Tax=Arthrobacter phage Kuleana TaxID=2653270 RepID=A0A5Q2WE14_9CAUD|nr:terminase [Arthrobacter phage Kuleana]QGH74490.1 terminase [Arthrobacter phage Kuleana]